MQYAMRLEDFDSEGTDFSNARISSYQREGVHEIKYPSLNRLCESIRNNRKQELCKRAVTTSQE